MVVSDLYAEQSTKQRYNNGSNFAVIALFITFLAFMLSASTPWVMDAFAPPPPVIVEVDSGEMAVDMMQKLWSWVFEAADTADTRAEQDISPKEEPAVPSHWTDYWSFLVVVIAFGGLLSAVIAFLQKQNRYIAGSAVILGTFAIIFQYILITLAVIIVLVILVFLLSAIGVDF
tara:strand:+ start:3505 stop:4026 length:522 start_codon:yes stop_codon:yes gene_type:complete